MQKNEINQIFGRVFYILSDKISCVSDTDAICFIQFYTKLRLQWCKICLSPNYFTPPYSGSPLHS